MKKIASLFILGSCLILSLTANAQQPDAQYNLLYRSYTLNDDGSMDIRFRKEITLLRNRAITAYADKGETFITYNPSFESLTINECYTLRADGSKVETPQNAFVLQLPSQCTDCGRLNDLREMAIVHTALEYNCTIVLDYTIHRNSQRLYESFDLRQDCPVKRYEIRYADGRRQVEKDLPQTVNGPYMPAKKGHDVVITLGEMPTYTAEDSLPAAKTLLAALKKDSDKQYATAIRDWVVDYVTLNNIDLARVNYAITPAAEVFASNCGTALDKAGLLAALLNQAGMRATLVGGATEEGFQPVEVELLLNGNRYRLSATQKNALLTDSEKADADAVAAAPIYVDRSLEWKPDTLVDGFLRMELPTEKNGLSIQPKLLVPSRTEPVQARATSEFYHYTLELPKGVKLVGGDVNLDYSRNVGSISILIKQKGNRLLITRSLRLRKAVVEQADYADFRQLIADWNSYRQLLFQQK